MPDDRKFCIVGAGPNGLIAARALAHAGIEYDHDERHTDVGGLWNIENPGSPVYERARFISSKPTSNFYGFPLPDHYPDYPNHRMLTAYIRAFAKTYGIYDRITFGTGVQVINQRPDGTWDVTLDTGETCHYSGVICSNGTNWHPQLPTYAGMDEFAGEMRHSVTYQSPDELRGKRVLVVGLGNSGADIASDAATAASHARVSVRRGYKIIPKYVFGLPTDQWSFGLVETPPEIGINTDDIEKLLDAVVGDLRKFGMPEPDHKLLESHPILNETILTHLRQGEVRIVPDVERFTKTGAVFTDGTEDTFDLVIFATGYKWKVPYLPEGAVPFESDRPILYLNAFPRGVDNLYFAGFCDFADGGFKRWNELAHLIVMDLTLQGDAKQRWEERKLTDAPVLSDIKYVDSPRHAHYVDTWRFQEILGGIYEEFDWPAVDDSFYESMRAGAPAQPTSPEAESTQVGTPEPALSGSDSGS